MLTVDSPQFEISKQSLTVCIRTEELRQLECPPLWHSQETDTLNRVLQSHQQTRAFIREDFLLTTILSCPQVKQEGELILVQLPAKLDRKILFELSSPFFVNFFYSTFRI